MKNINSYIFYVKYLLKVIFFIKKYLNYKYFNYTQNIIVTFEFTYLMYVILYIYNYNI